MLPPVMLVGTALLALASGAIAGSILIDAAARDGIDLPVALFVVALAGLGVTAWAWTKKRPVHA